MITDHTTGYLVEYLNGGPYSAILPVPYPNSLPLHVMCESNNIKCRTSTDPYTDYFTYSFNPYVWVVGWMPTYNVDGTMAPMALNVAPAWNQIWYYQPASIYNIDTPYVGYSGSLSNGCFSGWLCRSHGVYLWPA